MLRRLYFSRIGLVVESIIIGLAAGSMVSLFRFALIQADQYRRIYYERLSGTAGNGWLVPLLIQVFLFLVLGLFLGWLSVWKPMTKGSGIPQLKGYFEGMFQFQWLSELLVKMVSGILGIGAGLSLGREGPSVQIGSYVGMGIVSRSLRSEVEKNT
ncbi:chloride channel protein [Gracilinema caldarium]|uniref:chloride channel protein n=1 Tax=Gracilinema caldarium TaxID=215591 RepID=UPI0026F02949|nr:chloride channel protein [Gracilinema caldarium]